MMKKLRYIFLFLVLSASLSALRAETEVIHDTIYVPQIVYVHDTIIFCPELEELMFDIDTEEMSQAELDSLLNEIEMDLYYSIAMDSLMADSLEQTPEPDPLDASTADRIISYAKRYIGRPYVYGAAGPNAFDCSGFTAFAFKHVGIHLTRTSIGQSQQVRRLKGGFKNLRKGDLVFFGRRNRHTVGHVGIVISATDDDFTFIHAAVHSGITISHYHERYYRSCYMFAGRVLP